MRATLVFACRALVVVALTYAGLGCAVPQPPGNGQCLYVREPKTWRPFWLYLPEDYVEAEHPSPDGKKWPMVVTFHGMKPWDIDARQIREWQQEADNYGFIVLAPYLDGSDSFMEYPPTRVHWYNTFDERNTLAFMDYVVAKYDADPDRVLSTSWSSGGYYAHWMVNRHPDRFSCIAVRQSNFSYHIMDSAKARTYHTLPVAIFFGENDFAACRRESKQAVAWYRRLGFDVTVKRVVGLGHERTPQTAAAFFAKVHGLQPVKPDAALATLARVKVLPVSEAELQTTAIPVNLKADAGGPAAPTPDDAGTTAIRPSSDLAAADRG